MHAIHVCHSTSSSPGRLASKTVRRKCRMPSAKGCIAAVGAENHTDNNASLVYLSIPYIIIGRCVCLPSLPSLHPWP